MLVLQAQLGDVLEIWLEDGRTITVKYCERRTEGRVRLGFEADRGIDIYRKCVADAIRRGEPRPVK